MGGRQGEGEEEIRGEKKKWTKRKEGDKKER